MSDQQVMPGSVIITPTKMYEEMQDIGRKVDHLSSVVDPALNKLREDIIAGRGEHATIQAEIKVEESERKADVYKLDSRIRIVENWRWFVLGIAAVIGPAASILVSLVIEKW